MQAGGTDRGSPRIDELHAERRTEHERRGNRNAEMWKERAMLKKENIG